jgi:hypothetical protein
MKYVLYFYVKHDLSCNLWSYLGSTVFNDFLKLVHIYNSNSKTLFLEKVLCRMHCFSNIHSNKETFVFMPHFICCNSNVHTDSGLPLHNYGAFGTPKECHYSGLGKIILPKALSKLRCDAVGFDQCC